MFGFSMGEMFLLMAIALIAIGPKQLPEVARTLGKFMNELKRATSDFSRSFDDVASDTRNSWDQARKGINEAFTAGAASYDSSPRAAPEGTLANQEPGFDPNHAGDQNLHSTTHIEADDAALDPQGSLFVPTDLSNVQQDEHQPEEQLAFKLTSFDDESENS
jgi:Sec-independent protein translocase protein TatA